MKKIIGIVTPILLLILPYLLFVVLSVGMGRPDRDSSRLQMTQSAICIVYVVVVLLNVVWVICQTAAGTSAQTLLLWDMLMKLCYIPYYLLAALMVLAGFATFMFGGVAIIGVMWIADVLFLIPPSIYGLCGCIRACSEKKLSVGAAVALSILHFIFVLDVVAAVVGFCTVHGRHKRQKQMEAARQQQMPYRN